jgi:hypothetical protein
MIQLLRLAIATDCREEPFREFLLQPLLWLRLWDSCTIERRSCLLNIKKLEEQGKCVPNQMSVALRLSSAVRSVDALVASAVEQPTTQTKE